MKIMIRGMNIELTPSIKEYVEEKIGGITHLLDPKHEGLAEARVEVGKPSKHHHSGDVYMAEVNLKIGGEFFRATATHEDVHAAINQVRDDLDRQLRKHKTKEISKHRSEAQEA